MTTPLTANATEQTSNHNYQPTNQLNVCEFVSNLTLFKVNNYFFTLQSNDMRRALSDITSLVTSE
jgi:hypothetical protein